MCVLGRAQKTHVRSDGHFEQNSPTMYLGFKILVAILFWLEAGREELPRLLELTVNMDLVGKKFSRFRNK